jgi:RNA polymerase sigma factor (sigma-70 family)
MQKPTDTETLRGLQNREEAAYQVLYRCYYPVVEKFVLRNSGTRADARDLFQDALVVLWQQTSREGFTLTSSLQTYLFAISRNLWLKRLEKAQRSLRVARASRLEEDAPALAAGGECPSEAENTWARRLSHWLGRVTVHCQMLLKNLFLLGRSLEDLGYKNKHTAQNQQYKCLQQLRREAGDPARRDE